MEFSIAQLAELLGGKVEGDSEVMVNDLTQIENGRLGSICFLSDMKYADFLYQSHASAAIVAFDFVAKKELPQTLSLIRVENPRLSVGKILEIYHQYKNRKTGIHNSAQIAKSATIGSEVFIGANVWIGEDVVIGDHCRIKSGVNIGDNVKIGSFTHLYYNVTIEDDCRIGSHCIFQSGSVIGSEGFGFQANTENMYQKLYHIGNVIIEDYVEIGANTTIDRGTIGATRICKGVKLDNLIQVGHNVEIGTNTVAAALTGIGGSTHIGSNCMIGGQVGFAGHTQVANGVKLAARTGVSKNIKTENSIYQGMPAQSVILYRKTQMSLRKLPELAAEIAELKKEVLKFKSTHKGLE